MIVSVVSFIFTASTYLYVLLSFINFTGRANLAMTLVFLILAAVVYIYIAELFFEKIYKFINEISLFFAVLSIFMSTVCLIMSQSDWARTLSKSEEVFIVLLQSGSVVPSIISLYLSFHKKSKKNSPKVTPKN